MPNVTHEHGDQLRAQVVRQLLIPILRKHAGTLVLALLLMLVQSVATLVQPWLGGELTNRLMFSQGFGPLLWILFGLIVAQATLGYIAALQLQKVSSRFVAEGSTRLYEHLQALPLGWHYQRQRGDVLALLTGDVYRLGHYLTGTLVPLLPLLFTLVGALLMMLGMAPMIAVAVALLMPLLFLVLKIVGRHLRPLAHASMQAWADQSAHAEQGLEMLPVIKSFAATPLNVAQFKAGAAHLCTAEIREAKWQGAIAPMVQVVGAGVVLLLLGVWGNRVVQADMGMGQLVSLFLYGLVLVSPVSQLANVYGTTQSARGTLQRLRDCLAAPIEVDTGTIGQLPAHAELKFESVGFAYPGRAPLFDGLSLSIHAGETVALTGANGAGKSTLVHLLLRLVEPQHGRVSIGGVDVREFTLAALRGQIGLVSQQVMLFNATVRDNIAYGRVEASQQDIERAAHAARAHDFINALPEGYDTLVGDNGVRLSGGQKQRIALARALLKDPPILILDEATAMFDPAGELEFIEECRDVLATRTVILITHRPASLALADRIIQLDTGHLL